MKASVYQGSVLQWLFQLLQVAASGFFQTDNELITIVPFILAMMLVQQLNKLGFIIGAVQGLIQQYYQSSLPASIQNLIFGVQCAVQVTRDYIPKNLQGDGWLFLLGYMCYVMLGVLSLGLYLQQHSMPQTSLDLYYLGVISVGSVLMSSGLTSTWQQWVIVAIIGTIYSWAFQPLVLISLYGYYNWNQNT